MCWKFMNMVSTEFTDKVLRIIRAMMAWKSTESPLFTKGAVWLLSIQLQHRLYNKAYDVRYVRYFMLASNSKQSRVSGANA